MDAVRVLLDWEPTGSDGFAQVLAHGVSEETALHKAAIRGHVEICRLLLDRGALVCDANNRRNTALNFAARNGHLEVVQVLLSFPVAVEDISAQCSALDEVGWTALHNGANGGNIEICRLVLEHGVAVDVGDEDNDMPLHVAAAGGHLDVARLLLEHPAKDQLNKIARCRACNYTGGTALHSAAREG